MDLIVAEAEAGNKRVFRFQSVRRERAIEHHSSVVTLAFGGELLVRLEEDEVVDLGLAEVLVDDPVEALEQREQRREDDAAVLVDVRRRDPEHLVELLLLLSLLLGLLLAPRPVGRTARSRTRRRLRLGRVRRRRTRRSRLRRRRLHVRRRRRVVLRPRRADVVVIRPHHGVEGRGRGQAVVVVPLVAVVVVPAVMMVVMVGLAAAVEGVLS